jgi:hypothetical protein
VLVDQFGGEVTVEQVDNVINRVDRGAAVQLVCLEHILLKHSQAAQPYAMCAWLDQIKGEVNQTKFDRSFNFILIFKDTCKGVHVIIDGSYCQRIGGKCCSLNQQGTGGVLPSSLTGRPCNFCFFGGIKSTSTGGNGGYGGYGGYGRYGGYYGRRYGRSLPDYEDDNVELGNAWMDGWVNGWINAW